MNPKVVVLGAGYAGVSAVKRFARAHLPVTLVNPRAEFVERIRLHQLLAGTRAATVPLTSVLPRSTTRMRDSAEAVDPERRTVSLSGGDILHFDYLVYAVGSRGGLDAIPGAAEHAVTVGSLDQALVARERFTALPAASSITVVGGGLTGVETAAELAEPGGHLVRLVTDKTIAPTVGERGRDYLRRQLAALDVEVLENTTVTEIERARVVLGDGRTRESDLVVLTTTPELPRLARDSGLATEDDGALRVHSSLVSTGACRVVGAGDAARISADPVRRSCQAAIPLGVHAAETVLHLIEGTTPKPVRPKFTGQCISLGRRAALWQRTTRFDRPSPFIMTGKAGALLKEGISSATTRIALNPALAGFTYSWS